MGLINQYVVIAQAYERQDVYGTFSSEADARRWVKNTHCNDWVEMLSEFQCEDHDFTIEEHEVALITIVNTKAG